MPTLEDVIAITLPWPNEADYPEDALEDVRHEIQAERDQAQETFHLAWEEAGPEAAGDPLLIALGYARRQREAAEEQIRQLLAYGREFTGTRPYRLADLAAVAGMSISGVRTAYDHADVALVEERLGRRSRNWRAGSDDETAIEESQ